MERAEETMNEKIRRGARYGTAFLFALAAVLILSGIQAFCFHGFVTSRLDDANERFHELMNERRHGGARLAEQGESELNGLGHDYTDPYEDLQADLKAPPWYYWPAAALMNAALEYSDVVTFNRAIYLARIGELGTARVLLNGLHASADDAETLGLVYYALGRIEFEVYRSAPQPESYKESVHYTKSVQYLRQSLQSDPESSLAKRFYDYLLSLPPLETRLRKDVQSAPGKGAEATDESIF